MNYGNGLINLIYYNSPQFMRNFFSIIYDQKKARFRFGKYYNDYFEFLVRSQYWSNEKLTEFQWIKTREFLKYAYANIKYYKNLFDYVNVDPFVLTYPDDIKRIPRLTKEQIRKNYADIVSPQAKESKTVWEHTSGTTGAALRFPSSLEAIQEYYASRELQYKWIGLGESRKIKIAHLAGHPVVKITQKKPPFWVLNIVTNDLYFSSYHISDSSVKYYVDKLVNYKPEIITGYPSSICLVAEAVLAYKIEIKLKAVVTSSETLLEHQKEKIKKAFNCNVFDFYGNSENCGRILTCEKGQKHLILQSGFVEVENNELVVTNISNRLLPFIRYSLGDSISIDRAEKCSCGRNGLIVNEIGGRIEDYIITVEGRKVGRLDHIFKDSLNVREAQIYQSNVGEISLRIVRSPEYSQKDKETIIYQTTRRLGKNIKIRFEYLDHIPREKNGKFRFILTNRDVL